jgi:Protein of unknown function (DUF1439).
MTKRKAAWAAIIVVGLIALVGAGMSFFGVDKITMSQADLQQRIDAKMPHTTAKGITVSKVQLDLGGDKIALNISASAKKFNTEYGIDAATRGTLVYDGARGAFFFKPDNVSISKISANGASVGEKVNNFIDKWVDSPKINANKEEIAAIAEKWAQEATTSSAAYVLNRVPVYTLPNNFKGHVVQILLKDVEVKNGNVIAHLSIWQATGWVLFYGVLFLLALGLGVALVLNPEFGAAVMFLSIWS